MRPSKETSRFRPLLASPDPAHPSQAGKGQVQSGKRGRFEEGGPSAHPPWACDGPREISTILDTLPRDWTGRDLPGGASPLWASL